MDQQHIKSRIYVSNLPPCTRAQLEELFIGVGAVLKAFIQKNFGFPTFLSNQVNKESVVTISDISRSKADMQPSVILQAGKQKEDRWINEQTTNVCQLIVVGQTAGYSKFVCSHFATLGFAVGEMKLNKSADIPTVLDTLAKSGCLYALIITPDNVANKSVNVNLLYGKLIEYRDIQLNAAVRLIGDDYKKLMSADPQEATESLPKLTKLEKNDFQLLSPPVQPPPFQNYVRHKKARLNDTEMPSCVRPAVITSDHTPVGQTPIVKPQISSLPPSIHKLLNSLTNNDELTIKQYDHVIQYLQVRRTFLSSEPIENLFQKNLESIASTNEFKYEFFQMESDSSNENEKLKSTLSNEHMQNALDQLFYSDVSSICAKLN